MFMYFSLCQIVYFPLTEKRDCHADNFVVTGDATGCRATSDDEADTMTNESWFSVP